VKEQPRDSVSELDLTKVEQQPQRHVQESHCIFEQTGTKQTKKGTTGFCSWGWEIASKLRRHPGGGCGGLCVVGEFLWRRRPKVNITTKNAKIAKERGNQEDEGRDRGDC
jgi:hypothetical protein